MILLDPDENPLDIPQEDLPYALKRGFKLPYCLITLIRQPASNDYGKSNGRMNLLVWKPSHYDKLINLLHAGWVITL
jgi:hypothetical protein